MLALDPTVIRDIDAADEVRRALSDRVRKAVRSGAGPSPIDRVSVPVPEPVRPVDWVRAQDRPAGRSSEAAYWSGREETRTVAAIGAADVVFSTSAPVDYGALGAALDDRLGSANPSMRYYGGLRFDAAQPPAADRPDRRWAP